MDAHSLSLFSISAYDQRLATHEGRLRRWLFKESFQEVHEKLS
jgi:hypothetical protein